MSTRGSMYDHIRNKDHAPTVGIGSFTSDSSNDFKENLKATIENFTNKYSVNPILSAQVMLTTESLAMAWENELFSDVVNPTSESSFAFNASANSTIGKDEYFAMHGAKLQQLAKNSYEMMALEAYNPGQMSPIIMLTQPVLKKQYILNQFKDMVQTIVVSQPLVKYAYERRFLKDAAGKKKYFPDCFYDGSYYEFTDKSIGKPVNNQWYPKGSNEYLPVIDLNILEESGGSLSTRDALGLDFCIDALTLEVPSTGPNAVNGVEEIIVDGLNIRPDYGANNSWSDKVLITSKNSAVKEDTELTIYGSVDSYSGVVNTHVVGRNGTVVKKIRYGGHLSNANNDEIIEMDRERHNMEFTIGEKQRFNFGLTAERIKDEKALHNIDVTVEAVSDFSDVAAQTADSELQRYLETSYQKTKNMNRVFKPMGYDVKFTEDFEFDLAAPSTYMTPESQWRSEQIRYYLGRAISFIKTKLHDERLTFAMSANPYVIELLTATEGNVRWVVNNDSNIGGVKLDYKYGVMLIDGSRVQLIASQKETIEKGFRIVAIPLTDTVITYRRYDYSFNIETSYRNPLTQNTPNIMCSQRYENIEVLPLQSNFYIKQYRENNYAMTPSDVYKNTTAVPGSVTP